MNTRIIGLGSAHGDDRVGLAALQALIGHDLPAGCSLHTCAHPATELLALLDGAEHVVLVDAMVDGGPPGRVLCGAPGDLQPRGGGDGSHGYSVGSVLALATALGQMPRRLTLAGISIAADCQPLDERLSPAVRAAVPMLVQRLLSLASSPVAVAEPEVHA